MKAHYHHDNRIHRAKIIDIGEIDVLVKFIDYGNVERVTPDLIFKSHFNQSPFAFEVEIDALDRVFDDDFYFIDFLEFRNFKSYISAFKQKSTE